MTCEPSMIAHICVWARRSGFGSLRTNKPKPSMKSCVCYRLRSRGRARTDHASVSGANGLITSETTSQPSVVALRLTSHMDAWTVSGESVLPTGRKTRALLAAIALSAPRPASRGRLRRVALEPPAGGAGTGFVAPGDSVAAEGTGARKNRTSCTSPATNCRSIQGVTWVDVDEIMRSATYRPAALSLLDGDLLEDLEGIDPAFDIWLTGERERLRDRARGMAEAVLREQTDPGTVIPQRARLLQIDRAHEEALACPDARARRTRRKRGMAIQAYDRCRAALAEQVLDAACRRVRKLRLC